MIPIRVFEGREVAVFGLGLSGRAAARALQAGGAVVSAWDDGADARQAAAAAGLPLVDLAAADWSAFAALVLAPGVPLTHPEPHWTVRKAKDAGVEIIGDTELFFRERARERSAAKVVAITGTNGKSTTAALTAHVLRTAGLKTALGGNIGTAMLELDPLGDDMTYVIEFSSYQIDLTPTLKANAAALLNITPDHLDRHGTFENYAQVKAQIFSGLGPGDRAVVSIDDDPCRAIADKLTGSFEVVQISTLHDVAHGVTARDGALVETVDGKSGPPIDIAGTASLRGAHNWQNAAVAFALARGLGLDAAEIAVGLRSFPGLAHRMEEVGRRGRVVFVNDSKATNTDAAAKALASFDSIYWIAGGRAKTDGLAGLETYFSHIARAYLIGEAAEPFAETLSGQVDAVVAGTVEQAVRAAANDAEASAAPEPAVLFSPACASFDQYPNFEVRGDAFRAAVAALDGITMHVREAA